MKFFGGTGRPLGTGSVIVNGNVDSRMGISMVSGAVYVSGNVKQPLGNAVEVKSDRAGFRKFRSITNLLHGGLEDEILPPNIMKGDEMFLKDGIIRDTIAARLDADKMVIVDGDAGMSTGILMKRGFIRVGGTRA